MIKYNIIFILLVGCVVFIQAQEKTGLPCLNKTLTINVHIVKDKGGNPGITEANIQAKVDSMNTYFDTICLNFKICTVDYIDNYQYDVLDLPGTKNYKTLGYYNIDWLHTNENGDMISKFYVTNTINMYFVTDLYLKDRKVGGYASLPGGPDIIVLTKKAATSTYAHEMGHFLGLIHTFDRKKGQELVSRDTLNAGGKPLCELTGDLLCDTEADYNINEVAIPLNAECQYLQNDKDATGTFYMPPTNNIMSYYPDNCRVQFTPEQYKLMANQYLAVRYYLW